MKAYEYSSRQDNFNGYYCYFYGAPALANIYNYIQVIGSRNGGSINLNFTNNKKYDTKTETLPDPLQLSYTGPYPAAADYAYIQVICTSA